MRRQCGACEHLDSRDALKRIAHRASVWPPRASTSRATYIRLTSEDSFTARERADTLSRALGSELAVFSGDTEALRAALFVALLPKDRHRGAKRLVPVKRRGRPHLGTVPLLCRMVYKILDNGPSDLII
jgi:hypothetical protein